MSIAKRTADADRGSLVAAARRRSKKPPVASRCLPTSRQRDTAAACTHHAAAPSAVTRPTVVPPEPVRDDAIASATLDSSTAPPLKLFFALDSAEIDPEGKAASTPMLPA